MTKEELNETLKDHALWLENGGGKKADLQMANLQMADLRWAKLQGADLRWADLRWADLQGADLREVVADDATAGFWPVCPEKGCFTAFKKLAGGAIAELFIPEHAKRSSATTRKCRCSEAIVVEIKDREGDDINDGLSSQADGSGRRLLYRVGETVYPDGFDEDRWNECSNGIHFFMTRREAELY